MLKYPARFKPDGEMFFIEFLDIPDAFTQGETMDELIMNARDVLSATLECMLDENADIPEPSKAKGEDIIYVEPNLEIALPGMIRKFRKVIGESQGEVAQKMKIPYQTYQRWERAERFNPTIKTLNRIADALGKKLIIDMVEK